MDPYAVTLLVALIAAGVAVGAALAGLVARRSAPSAAAALRGVVGWGGGLALGSGAASVAIHIWLGHRPGTPEALGVHPFLAEHPSYLVVLAAGILALGWAWRTRP